MGMWSETFGDWGVCGRDGEGRWRRYIKRVVVVEVWTVYLKRNYGEDHWRA